MDFLASFATMNNFTAIVLLACLIALIIGVRTGNLKFNGKGLEVGIQDKERRIMQRQTTYVHGRLDAVANQLLHDHPNFDEYRTKWICKCAELELIRSIHYNHIEDTEGYREDRFIALRDIVQKKTTDDFFFSKEFENFLRAFIKETVAQLAEIRKRA